jgi:hypothetical protein
MSESLWFATFNYEEAEHQIKYVCFRLTVMLSVPQGCRSGILVHVALVTLLVQSAGLYKEEGYNTSHHAAGSTGLQCKDGECQNMMVALRDEKMQKSRSANHVFV